VRRANDCFSRTFSDALEPNSRVMPGDAKLGRSSHAHGPPACSQADISGAWLAISSPVRGNLFCSGSVSPRQRFVSSGVHLLMSDRPFSLKRTRDRMCSSQISPVPSVVLKRFCFFIRTLISFTPNHDKRTQQEARSNTRNHLFIPCQRPLTR
jgi:hypothetical protein